MKKIEVVAAIIQDGDKIFATQYIDTVEYDYPEFHLTMHCFLCRVLKGSLTLLEHEACRWLAKDELDMLEWLPADLDLIEEIKEIL